ncbi:putative ferredoxin [Spironucleus salmonicida]|uniref:Ferredoxin n=1 Tax=Spironucleus salmonicida TaxID=348837 RepID=V6LH83_9EUKA|nr:putative ferredoxin [Spironucleus salmonicida]|eukprot:EST43076.1 Putative ferredoxin [Spironucleus salmonicida]
MRIQFIKEVCKLEGTCVISCPFNIVKVVKENGIPTFKVTDHDLCTECYQCINACRNEALRFDSLYE